jgi:hypothetical protein
VYKVLKLRLISTVKVGREVRFSEDNRYFLSLPLCGRACSPLCVCGCSDVMYSKGKVSGHQALGITKNRSLRPTVVVGPS